MNNQDAIGMLKSMLPEKISYAELIGASSCYGDGGLVYADPEPYAIETAISALEKQIPKKPELVSEPFDDGIEQITRYIDLPYCPSCEDLMVNFKGHKYCTNCGQAIDWRNEDE